MMGRARSILNPALKARRESVSIDTPPLLIENEGTLSAPVTP